MGQAIFELASCLLCGVAICAMVIQMIRRNARTNDDFTQYQHDLLKQNLIRNNKK